MKVDISNTSNNRGANIQSTEEDKLSTILMVLTQMKEEIKINNKNITNKINTQNDRIDKLEVENNKENNKINNIDKRLKTLEEKMNIASNNIVADKESNEKEIIDKERRAANSFEWKHDS